MLRRMWYSLLARGEGYHLFRAMIISLGIGTFCGYLWGIRYPMMRDGPPVQAEASAVHSLGFLFPEPWQTSPRYGHI